MSFQLSGFVTEVGGEELGKTGNPKPRKIVVKESLDAQYGKTFRVWQDSDEFQTLVANNGKYVTVIYEVEQREGGPKGSYTQNMVIGVDASGDGAGTPTAWDPPPSDSWTDSPATSSPAPSPEPSQQVAQRVQQKQVHIIDTQTHIVASWAIKSAIQTLGPGATSDAIHQRAHELIVMKERIASELSR
jgi:hypothetical protein